MSSLANFSHRPAMRRERRFGVGKQRSRSYKFGVNAGAQMPARKGIVRARKRIWLIGIVSALSFGAFACRLLEVGHKPSESKCREIASALLEYHSGFGKGRSSRPIPNSLRSPTLQEIGAGWCEAYVDYEHRPLGIAVKRRFLLLENTNDVTWTLYETSHPESRYLNWLKWKRRLITVTNTAAQPTPSTPQ